MISLTLISSAIVSVAACSWDDPGVNSYKGAPPLAVHNYSDIPHPTRTILQKRMELLQYDDIAVITRDSIRSIRDDSVSYNELRDMHFGKNKVCTSVSREKWKDVHIERGLIYCEETHCLIVPTVCNNVSRVTKVKENYSKMPASVGADPGTIENIPSIIDDVYPVQTILSNEQDSIPMRKSTVPSLITPNTARTFTDAAGIPPWGLLAENNVYPRWIYVTTPVSEPGTVLMFLAGIAGLIFRKFIAK